MVALREKEFQNRLSVMQKAIGFGRHLHAFFYLQNAGRKKLGRVLDLYEAEPARADIRQPIQVTERWDEDIVFARYLQNCLVGAGAHIYTVDDECFYIYRNAHAVTSSPVASLLEHAQTPARQCLLSMCSRYSFLK